MLTKRVEPSGEKQTPASSEELKALRPSLYTSPAGVTPRRYWEGEFFRPAWSSQRTRSPQGAIVRLSAFSQIVPSLGSTKSSILPGLLDSSAVPSWGLGT